MIKKELIDNLCACIQQQQYWEINRQMYAHLSPFSILFLPQKQLAFHAVELSEVLQTFPHDFFSSLSDYFDSQGIHLVHLWQDYWETRQALVASRIHALLGEVKRIHARQTIIERIDKYTADNFLLNNHLYVNTSSRYKYGIYYKGMLAAVATFSAARPINRNGEQYRSFELIRFANAQGCIVVGGLGKLLARFITDCRPDDIMTYADRDWASGKGYEKLNFKCIETTEPQLFWLDMNTKVRYYPQRLPLLVQKAFENQKEITTIAGFLQQRNFIRVYNSGNYKYLLLLK